MTIKKFKLRHKPSGLFYQSKTGTSNLTETGKFYTQPFKVPDAVVVTLTQNKKLGLMDEKLILRSATKYVAVDVPRQNWEWVEYSITEVAVRPVL